MEPNMLVFLSIIFTISINVYARVRHKRLIREKIDAIYREYHIDA